MQGVVFYLFWGKGDSTIGLELAKAWIRVRADASQVTGDLNRAKPGILKATSRLGGAMQQAMGAAGFAGIGMGIFKAISTAATFEQTMVNVRANARLLGKEGEAAFMKMEKAVRKLGATTVFSSVQAAEAMDMLVLGGLDEVDAVAALPAVLDLAASAGMGMAESAKIIVDNMIKYNMAAKDTGIIADYLSSAQSRAQIEARELGAAHQTLGAIAAEMGASFLDVTTILTGMGRSSTDMNTAGTALAMALARMTDETGPATKVLKDMGIEIGNFTKPGGGIDLIPLFRAIADAMPEDPIKRGAKAIELFGIKGKAMLGIFGLMRRGRYVEDTAKGLENDIGRAARVAAAMMDTFTGTLKEVISALSELAIATLTPVLKALEPVVDAVKLLALGFAKAAVTVQKWDNAMGGMIGRTVKAMVAVVALRRAILLLGPAARLASVAIRMATISTGWFAIVAVIGTVVAGVITLIDWLRKTKPVQDALKASADTFRIAWERVKQAFDIAAKLIVSGLVQILNWTGLANIDIRSIADFVINASEWVVAFLQNWSKVKEALPGFFKVALSYAADLFVNWIKFQIDMVWFLIKSIGRAFMMIPKMLLAAMTGEDVGAVVMENIRDALKDAPSVGDIFVPSDRTKRIMKKELGGVFESIAKSKGALELQRATLLGDKGKKAGASIAAAAAGAGGATAGERPEARFEGFREMGRRIQLDVLNAGKKDKQAEMVELLGAGNKIQEQVLNAVKDQEEAGALA